MVLIAFTWLFIAFCSFVFGKAAIMLLNKYLLDGYKPQLELTAFIGLLSIGVIANIVSCFRPVNDELLITIAGFSVYYAYKNRESILVDFMYLWQRVLRTTLFEWGAVALLFGFCLAKASVLSTSHDEGVYYLQTIRWNAEYGLVPGLGNLEGRFAFNSSWHVLMALFGFQGLNSLPGNPNFNDIGELSALLIGIWCVEGLSLCLRGERSYFNTYRALMLMAWPLIVVHNLSSPMADLGVMLCIWVVIGLLIQQIEERAGQTRIWLVIGIAAVAITIKLSAIIMAIIPLFYFRKTLSTGKPIRALAIAVFSILILSPWAYRTWVISGYWLYPIKATGFLSADWKMPEKELDKEAFDVTRFARFGPDGPKGKVPNGWYEQENPAFTDWVPYWYNHTLSITEQIFFALSFLSCIGLILQFFTQLKTAEPIAKELNWVGLLLVAGACFWFLKGPSFRFGYGYLIPLTVLFLLMALKANEKIKPKAIQVFGGLCVLLFSFQAIDTRAVKQNLIFPAAYPKVPLSTKMVGGLEVAMPAGYYNHDGSITPCTPPECVQCWNAPLPCVFELQKGLIRRGYRLEDGFKIDSDLAKIQE